MTFAPLGADAVLDAHLDEYLGKVSDAFEADALTWYGPIAFGLENLVRRTIEERRTDGRDKLVVLVTTNGGLAEVVQRAVDIMRHHYRVVDFIIPDYAFSAGTIMAMSGDAIHMDYAARLGPIDPQIQRGDRFVPALGYCEQYDDLIKKSRREPLSDAEISVLVGSFDQAELYEFRQARELSISLLKEWLVQYKFKDWHTTETRGVPVTLRMKRSRAATIAKVLSNSNRWHSHGAGISARVLREELQLKIDDLDLPESEERKKAISEYHALLEDSLNRRGHVGCIHMRGRFIPYHVH